jgi:3'(2'), 5'-bisphosphate nucleotidase
MIAALSDAHTLRLVKEITPLARDAGAKIMTYYQGDFEVRSKADASPVTAADEAAEAIIIAGLNRLTPDIPVIAEEASAAGKTADVSAGRFWLVDPLDGTKEFVNHRDEFTVNIALIDNRQPVLGVVFAPALDVFYAAAGQGTATAQRGTGAAHPISARCMPATGAIVTASRSHSDKKKIQELMDLHSIKEMKISGSSIKFCLIAEGTADIYPRYGHTREWDTAAGHAVLAAAGGSVRSLDGSTLLYNKEGFLNNEFIACGLDN